MSKLFLIAAASYLLGSIPFGYLLVRVFRGEDVRQTGSGNIGATNVSRKSPTLGVLTLLLDALKGASGVALASQISHADVNTHYTAMSMAAMLAVIGHMFPAWLKFRGGKGVATGLGSFGMIAPKSVLIAAGIFVLLVLIFRYVSLGSIVAVAVFPILTWRLREYGNAPVALVFMTLGSALIVLKHHQNIRRLLAGTENRFGSKHGTGEKNQE